MNVKTKFSKMKIKELIESFEKIKNSHGDDVEVLLQVIVPQCGDLFYSSPSRTDLENIRYIQV